MRINHNISAMNAHRLLNVNNAFASKSLEKLSSGKRINRAGDDAAGMAITEKMRAQIKGLKIASRNSLDGVSLVQTAEGAMAEIDSMLQRMRELAVQAANGTSTESDRQAIQDEINQLTSEVNRIANGTEYNTRKILRGNESPNSNTIVGKMSTGEPASVSTDSLNISSSDEILKKDLSNKTLSVEVNGKKTEVNLQGFSGNSNTTLTAQEFLNRINDALGEDAVATFNGNYEIEIKTLKPGGGQNIKIEGSAVGDLFNGKTEVSAYGLAENSGGTSKGSFYFSNMPEVGSFITIGNDRIDFFDSSKEPYVGSNKAIDISKLGYEEINEAVENITKTTPYQPATPPTTEPGKITIPNLYNVKDGDTIKIGGTALTFKDSPSGSDEVQIGNTLNDTITNLNTLFGTNSIDPHDFEIQTPPETSLELDLKTVPADIDTKVIELEYPKGTKVKFEFDTDGNVTPPNVAIGVIGGDSAESLGNALKSAIESEFSGLSVEVNGSKLKITSNDGNGFKFNDSDLSSITTTSVDTDSEIKSSTILTIEDKSGSTVEKDLIFTPNGGTDIIGSDINKNIAGTPEQNAEWEFKLSKNLEEGQKVIIDGVELVAVTGTPGANEFKIGATISDTLDNLVNSMNSNSTLTGIYSSISKSGDKVVLETASNHTLDVKLVSGKQTNINKTVEELVQEIKDNIQLDDVDFEIGTNNPRELVVVSKNPGFEGNLITLEGTLKEFNTNLQVGANSGQSFRLQVGDIRAKALKISCDKPTGNPGVTGAAYVKMPNVTDGISSNMVEYAIDVTSEEKASAAIKVFDNAILKVTAERSLLGATQNRLEHTIANLDNTGENLTAAMSRIEDTDMALEMANYQKLNVLQQAGVSMLAQANQQPQSILKLLG